MLISSGLGSEKTSIFITHSSLVQGGSMGERREREKRVEMELSHKSWLEIMAKGREK